MTLSSRLRLTTALPQSAQQPSWDTCSALLTAAELHISSVNCVQPDTPWYLRSRASFLFRLKSEGSGTAVCTPWPHLCRKTHRKPDGPCGPRHVENANFSRAPSAIIGFDPETRHSQNLPGFLQCREQRLGCADRHLLAQAVQGELHGHGVLEDEVAFELLYDAPPDESRDLRVVLVEKVDTI